MLEQRRVKETRKYGTTLYCVVFESALVKCAVIGLFTLLLLQPIAPVFAAADDVVDSQTAELLPEPTVIDTVDEPQDVVETVAENNIVETPPITEPIIVEEISTTVDPVMTENAVVLSETSQIETVVSNSSDVDIPSGATSTESVASTSTQENVPLELVTESETVVPEQLSTTTAPTETVVEVTDPQNPVVEATTIDDVVDVVATSTEVLPEKLVVVEHNSNEYEFDTSQCAVVGSGAYYCSNPSKSLDPLKDGVFAAPDSGGDLEIYVRLNGEEKVITSNNVDDSAPYYDALSQRIVWHSMVNDRYQIVLYDTKTDKQSYLTDTLYNNMQPVAYGDVVLWQAWIDNNWEIVMFDGKETKQLTQNTVQDVSPHMRGGYIVWQTQFSNGWQVAVYDQKTKTIEYIPSESGLKVENPRFVLVYDSTNDQGDVQTVGYDFDKKVTFALGSLPAQLPDELPNPDQTGETRALIQNKQASKEGENEVIDVPVIGSNNTPTSTKQVGTLDLTLQATSTPLSATIIFSDIVDIVIPTYTSTTTVSQEIITIPDVVIPPLVGTSTLEVR